MAMKPFLNARTSNDKLLEPNEEIVKTNGIYIGKVKSIDSRTGKLKVYILNLGNNRPDDPDSWQTVNYASPYLGYTIGEEGKNSNSIYVTKKPYGFSMILPDIDNSVLCVFPDSSTSSEGFWFACVSPNLNHYSLPAHGSAKLSNIDKDTIPRDMAKFLKPGGYYPVGEPNEINAYASSRPLSYPKSLNPDLTMQYIIQGLDSDIHRGVITSSSQRDGVSSVFGFNTPGRPFKDQDLSKIYPNLQQLFDSGEIADKPFVKVTGRYAGHSFVMDDGDVFGKNQLTRWRTAAGHQILMNDNIGSIYVSNASGLSWVELTAQGDVLIWGARDVSVRAQGNIDMHADNSFRIDAKNIEMFSEESIKMESQQQITMYATTSMSQHSSDEFSINTNNLLNVYSGGKSLFRSVGDTDIKGDNIDLNSSTTGATSIIPTTLRRENVPDAIFEDTGWAVQDQILPTICQRVPTHEPYLRGTFEGTVKALKTFVDNQNYNEKKKSGGVQSPTNTINNIANESLTNPLNDAASSVASASDALSSATSSIQGITATTGAITAAPPKLAPDSTFKTQPIPPESITGFEKQETQAYLAQIGHTESSGKYDAVNQFGYAGKYQMGAAALIDAGLVKPGTKQSVEELQNPNNWVGGAGKPNSLDEFLSNQDLQEKTAVEYTNRNYKTLQRLGVINENTPKNEISGILASSHLVGPGGAAKLVKTGVDPTDANGTKASQYYINGKTALAKAVPIVTAQRASQQLGVS
jgi:hypothetical protein